MGRLTDRLNACSVVGLDTAIFIYHFEQNPLYLPLTRELLSGIEQGNRKGVTSTITLLEIIVKPLASGQPEIGRKYEALLTHFPHLDIVDLNRNVIRKAAWLRAAYNLRTPDALQVGASLVNGAEAFITNDRRLERLRNQCAMIILDDYR